MRGQEQENPPQADAPHSAQLFDIAEGPEGVRQTLEVMRRIVKAARVTPDVRNLAVQLTAGLSDDDFIGEIRALFYFVRDQIRYVGDVNEVETIQTPQVTLELGGGDCDDKSTLLAALLEAIGHPARFAAVAFMPDDFEHVLVETVLGDPRNPKSWLALETTPVETLPGGKAEPGWYPPDVVSKMIRHI